MKRASHCGSCDGFGGQRGRGLVVTAVTYDRALTLSHDGWAQDAIITITAATHVMIPPTRLNAMYVSLGSASLSFQPIDRYHAERGDNRCNKPMMIRKIATMVARLSGIGPFVYRCEIVRLMFIIFILIKKYNEFNHNLSLEVSAWRGIP